MEEMPLFCIYNILLTCQLFWMLFFGLDTSNVVTQCAPPFPLIIRHREAVFTMDREGIFKLKMAITFANGDFY